MQVHDTETPQTPSMINHKQPSPTYLFAALGRHLGAALPVAGVATRYKQQNSRVSLMAFPPTSGAAVSHNPSRSDSSSEAAAGCDVHSSLTRRRLTSRWSV